MIDLSDTVKQLITLQEERLQTSLESLLSSFEKALAISTKFQFQQAVLGRPWAVCVRSALKLKVDLVHNMSMIYLATFGLGTYL